MARHGDDDIMPYGLWLKAVDRATYSKRGQQALRELEQALLAIPDRRLAYEHISLDGQVCAIGAYAAWKRQQDSPSKDRSTIIETLEDENLWDSESLRDSAELGQEVGLAWSLAWEIASANDYDFSRGYTPEDRWTKMLAWIKLRIIQPAV